MLILRNDSQCWFWKTMVNGGSGDGGGEHRGRSEKEIAIEKFYKGYISLDL